MVATSYLDAGSLIEKHWTSVTKLEELKRLGCLLLEQVDVHDMDTNPNLNKMKFDIIIFNFPHAGHYDYLSERNQKLIQMHRELVGAFFRSASKMLREGGEVHIRHRDDYPYNKWGVVSLANKVGLNLKEKVLFDKSEFFGYHNKRGGDVQTNKKFPIGYAFTFKFVVGLSKGDDQVSHLKDDDVDDEHVKNDVHDDSYVDMLEGLCLKDDDKDDDKGDDKDKEDDNYYERYTKENKVVIELGTNAGALIRCWLESTRYMLVLGLKAVLTGVAIIVVLGFISIGHKEN